MITKTSNTCIAVITSTPKRRGSKTELIFAADRRISWGCSKYQVAPISKMIKRKGMIMAGAGNGYLCDVIMRISNIPDFPKNFDSFDYMHNAFYGAVTAILKEKGFNTSDHGGVSLPDDMSCCVLVGIDHKLFEVVVDPSAGVMIDQVSTPYAAGCGGQYALGSLKTTQYLKIDDISRLKIALNVAADSSSGCDKNIDIIRASDEDAEE